MSIPRRFTTNMNPHAKPFLPSSSPSVETSSQVSAPEATMFSPSLNRIPSIEFAQQAMTAVTRQFNNPHYAFGTTRTQGTANNTTEHVTNGVNKIDSSVQTFKSVIPDIGGRLSAVENRVERQVSSVQKLEHILPDISGRLSTVERQVSSVQIPQSVIPEIGGRLSTVEKRASSVQILKPFIPDIGGRLSTVENLVATHMSASSTTGTMTNGPGQIASSHSGLSRRVAALERRVVNVEVHDKEVKEADRDCERQEKAHAQSGAQTVGGTQDRLKNLEQGVNRIEKLLAYMRTNLNQIIIDKAFLHGGSGVPLEFLNKAVLNVVETVINRFETLQDEEMSRQQVRAARYARVNRVLREKLRYKSARNKEILRSKFAMELSKLSFSASQSHMASNNRPAKHGNSSVDCSSTDQTYENIPSSPESPGPVKNKAATIPSEQNSSKAKMFGSNDVDSNDLVYDFSFFESVDELSGGTDSFSRHFTALEQADGLLGQPPQVSISSANALAASIPSRVLQTGLDISRGVFSVSTLAIAAAGDLVPKERPREVKLVPWDGQIHWAANTAMILSDDRKAYSIREGLAGEARSRPGKYPEGLPRVWKYGVRYIPPISMKNIYRTIVMSNLPQQISAGTLLRQVRGGIIYSVNIVDTAKVMGSSSAIVQFVDERAAASFASRATISPVTYDEKRAHIAMVKTASWPPAPYLEEGIARGYTRVLVVLDFNNPVHIDALLCDLKGLSVFDTIEGSQVQEGSLIIRFLSIRAANAAYEWLERSPMYNWGKLTFGKDPCSSC